MSAPVGDGVGDPGAASQLFAGQCAIVTGASRGIGRAIATRLCEEGANVVHVARTASDIQMAPHIMGTAIAFPVDIAAAGSEQEITRFALKHFGRIDILVHAAGLVILDRMTDLDVDAVSAMLRVNFLAPYAITRAALEPLRQTQGQVVFINSTIIRGANIAGRGGYAATKHALKALADSLRDEVNELGIRVISIMPGTTATDAQERLHRAAGKSYEPGLLLQPADIAQTTCDALALPRNAELTELYIRPMNKT